MISPLVKYWYVSAAILVGMTFTGAATASPVNLIKDGSFESVVLSNRVAKSISSLAGWQVGANQVEVRNNLVGSAYDGNNFVELDVRKNSWISQSFATVIGQTYEVSFFYSPRMGVAESSNGIKASAGQDDLQVSGSGVGKSGNIWKEYSFLFTADRDSETLVFSATGTSDSYGGSLDAVSVTAVPEPASWSIVLLGLAGLGLIRRRTR